MTGPDSGRIVKLIDNLNGTGEKITTLISKTKELIDTKQDELDLLNINLDTLNNELDILEKAFINALADEQSK